VVAEAVEEVVVVCSVIRSGKYELGAVVEVEAAVDGR